MLCRRRLKIKFPFKIRPRLYMVVKIEETVIKRQKRRNRKRRRIENKIKEEEDKRINEFYFVL